MKTIEEKFRKLDDIEHALLRPGMYVGSTKTREEEVHLLNEQGRFAKRPVQVNPAFMKIFDEIVSNAADEHRRNTKLNQISVTTDKVTGRITVLDNGGIPVAKHKDHDEWVPELIFSNLKAGSNFDDSEERLVAGTNGVGATLTNIFSTEFRIRTCDGKNTFDQVFTGNMRNRSEPQITKGAKGFTEISYIPDFSRFGLTGLDDDHVEMMRKRCADIAACNPLIRVEFNGERFNFSSFSAYCRLYTENVFYEGSERWRIAVGTSNGSMQQVSFVNGVETKDGGTHVDFVTWQIVEAVRARLKKKNKIDLKPAEIRNHMFVFVSCDIVNSSFSSQTKEKLITDPRDFGSKHELSDKFLKQVCESEMIQRILDWAQQKSMAEERKKLRELNKQVSGGKVLKLIDAKSRNREECTLALFEGDSASSAFRKYRDPTTQGAFPLRGKFLNVSELPASKVIQNQEVKDILTALGLRMGEEPKDLRYGKVLVYSDADPDGDSIAGLLTNFFGRYWPELLKDNRFYRVMTPLVVAKKGKETVPFYTHEEFEKWQKATKDIKKWDVSYKKGLAALEDEEYAEIIKNPRMFSIVPGEDLKQTLDNWFGADPAMRKKKILGEA
jgi:DNA topoisomerase-2